MLQRGPVRLKAGEIETRITARKARQAILAKDPAPSTWFILDEAVIRRVTGGPEVMRQQLLHLAEVAERSDVDLQVIPFSAGAHAGTLGPLVILRFAEGEDVVYRETYGGDLYPEVAASYDDVLNRLAQEALSNSQSLDLIRPRPDLRRPRLPRLPHHPQDEHPAPPLISTRSVADALVAPPLPNAVLSRRPTGFLICRIDYIRSW